VASHLYRIFPKLGIASRAQLTAMSLGLPGALAFQAAAGEHIGIRSVPELQSGDASAGQRPQESLDEHPSGHPHDGRRSHEQPG
jgi:hypothetical protein